MTDVVTKASKFFLIVSNACLTLSKTLSEANNINHRLPTDLKAAPVKRVQKPAITKFKVVKKQIGSNRNITKTGTKLTGVYTMAEFQKYKQVKKELQMLTVPQLQALLKMNDIRMNGKKQVLIGKVADGRVLGRIPLCTTCKGGKLSFDHKTGEYKCLGYQSDTGYIKCRAKFSKDLIRRDQWI
jgi:hypothetical protein